MTLALSFKSAVFLMPLMAAVLWGLVYAIDEQLLKHYTMSSLVTFTGAVTMVLGIAWAIGERDAARIFEPFNTGTRGWLFFMAILGAALASIITWTVIKYVSPTYAALGEISYPIFVPIFAYLLFNEKQWDTATIVGGGLIMLGLAVLIIGRATAAPQGVM